MRPRSTWNSGAPRRGLVVGNPSPRPMRSVQPTSSCSGRLKLRLKWPATPEAIAPMTRTSASVASASLVATARNTKSACRDRSMLSRRVCSCASSTLRCASVSGAVRAAAIARSPEASTLSHAAVPALSGRKNEPVALHASEMRIDGTRANARRMKKRRPRNPTRFTGAPYELLATPVSVQTYRTYGWIRRATTSVAPIVPARGPVLHSCDR